MLIHAGPGAGKTLGALLTFKEMRKALLVKKLVIFCHRNSIANQWIDSASKIGLNLNIEEEDGENLNVTKKTDGFIVTYQSAARNSKLFKSQIQSIQDEGFIAIADEAHHLGIDPEHSECPGWGQTFLGLTENAKLRIGLTGTPFRSDNLPFCSARKIRIVNRGEYIEQITPDLCIEPRELISEGDVRPLEFHFQDGWVEHSFKGCKNPEVSPISLESRETWRARNLRRAIKISDKSTIAIQLILKAQQKLERIKEKEKNAAGLIIAKDIEHAKAIASLLIENGNSVELVHSQDKEAGERLNSFQSSQSNWLVSVDMCSEGFDAPRLRVVAYLTTVVTKSRFIQGITRAVRVNQEISSLEAIPRKPSYIFAPADPLLMQYAKEWSKASPYVIKTTEDSSSYQDITTGSRGPSLPMQAIGDGAGELIKMGTPELPIFLKR